MVYMAGHTYASAFQIGPKGRVVIPVATRRAANLAEGDEVVAIALGEGRVLIQTVDAVRQRVWRAAPTAAPNPTKDVRQMRLEDNAVAEWQARGGGRLDQRRRAAPATKRSLLS